MTHWLILPIVLPAMLAAFMVLAARYHLLIQRVLSVTGTLGLLALALGLFWQASVVHWGAVSPIPWCEN